MIKVTQSPRDAYDRGRWEVFELITSSEFGKQCYFLEPNGIVYSRRSHQHMTFEDAVKEFLSVIGDDKYI